jgi:hypothetical protein
VATSHQLARTVVDASGVSHFDDVEIAVLPFARAARTEPIVVTSAEFVLAQDMGPDPHPAPRRQFVIVLEGVIEIGCGSGEVRRFGPGQLLLVQDTDGAGHSFRTVQEPVSVLSVALADGELAE